MLLRTLYGESLHTGNAQAYSCKVPPAGQLDQVPIGVSSASMYPGYSPADHVYGDAAQEFGTAVSIAKAKGIEIPSEPDGPEYQIAQARGIKMRTLAQVRAAKAARGEGSGSGTGSGSDAQAASARTIGPVTNGHAKQGAGEDGTEEGESQFFVIDTNPTPVNLPGIISKSTKRTSEDRSPPEPTEKKKSKKVKTKHDGELPLNVENERVELEDISEEVDARLKEKEEKRKRKEEKKRKRESEGSNLTAEKVADAVAEMEKSKKKKSKKSEGGDMLEKSALKKRHGASDEEVGDGEGKKKKKRKKNEG